MTAQGRGSKVRGQWHARPDSGEYYPQIVNHAACMRVGIQRRRVRHFRRIVTASLVNDDVDGGGGSARWAADARWKAICLIAVGGCASAVRGGGPWRTSAHLRGHRSARRSRV